jgi:hypothetical protein
VRPTCGISGSVSESHGQRRMAVGSDADLRLGGRGCTSFEGKRRRGSPAFVAAGALCCRGESDPGVGMEATVTFRGRGGGVWNDSWESAAAASLQSAALWRTFRWCKGQKRYSGTYWSAMVRDRVIDHIGHRQRLTPANTPTPPTLGAADITAHDSDAPRQTITCCRSRPHQHEQPESHSHRPRDQMKRVHCVQEVEHVRNSPNSRDGTSRRTARCRRLPALPGRHSRTVLGGRRMHWGPIEWQVSDSHYRCDHWAFGRE